MSSHWATRSNPFTAKTNREIAEMTPEERQRYERREINNATPLNLRARRRQRARNNERHARKATARNTKRQRLHWLNSQAIAAKIELAVDAKRSKTPAGLRYTAHLKQVEHNLGPEGRKELAKVAEEQTGQKRSWSQLDKGTKLSLLVGASHEQSQGANR